MAMMMIKKIIVIQARTLNEKLLLKRPLSVDCKLRVSNFQVYIEGLAQ
jgi:hypothetical protein